MKVLPTPWRASAWLISHLQHGRDEELGVGLARVVEHLVGEPGLDHAALAHHHDAVGDEPGHGEVGAEGGLATTRLIHTDWGPSGASFPSWANWFDEMDISRRQTAFHGMVANSSMAALDLARGGLGVALAQGLFCSGDLAAGRLVIVGKALQLSSPYCVTVPIRSCHRGIVTAFKAWFEAECRNCVEGAALIGGFAAPN